MKATRWFFIAAAIAGGFAASARSQIVNGIQAVVHDSVVTRYEVEELTSRFEPTLRRQFSTRPEAYTTELAKVRNDSAEKLIERHLILNDYKASGLAVPESYLEEIIQEEIRNDYGNRANLTKTLQAQGLTFEKYRQQSRDRIVEGLMRNRNISQETIVSPHKIEVYYKEHQADYAVEAQVKLRMIVLNVPTASDMDAAKKTAAEITAKIKEGAPFSEMASIYSQGSQKNQGGDLGWVEEKGLRKELREAAAGLKAGELSSPIETADTVYLVLVEDKRPAHARPLNEIREEIEKILLQQEQSRAAKRYIDKLKKKTFVRYF